MNVNPFSYLIEKLKSKVSKSGDTMSGSLSVRVSGNAYAKVTNIDKSVDITLNSAVNGQHGLYSNGYNDGTFHDSGKWLINRETNGTTKLNGNITVPSSSGTLALTSDITQRNSYTYNNTSGITYTVTVTGTGCVANIIMKHSGGSNLWHGMWLDGELIPIMVSGGAFTVTLVDRYTLTITASIQNYRIGIMANQSLTVSTS